MNDNRASFSNYGSHISVAAPGVGILSTVRGGYQSWSGTSVASPQVAGLAGLIISQNPSLSNTQVRQIIEQSADDLGAAGRDDYFGYGRINVQRALVGGLIPTSVPPRPTFTPSPAPTGVRSFKFVPVVLKMAAPPSLSLLPALDIQGSWCQSTSIRAPACGLFLHSGR